jgi:hypothetical protein
MQTVTLDQLRATVEAGGVKGVTLSAQGGSFYLQITTRAGHHAVLAKARSTEPRKFGNPTTAIMVMRDLGIGVALIEMSRWDPDQRDIAPQGRDRRASAMREAHQAAAHQKQLAAELQAAIDDPRPSLSTDEMFAALEADALNDAKPAPRGLVR